jgi:DNA primase
MYVIGFDLDYNRITIPMRNRFGELVGFKCRIIKDEDDERKYLYLHRFQNRYEWFNLHYALPYIVMDKRVYIFEAEKSTMKAYQYGIFNAVAIGASEISPEQAQIIKQIGLDVEIVFCYDKGISLSEIQDTASLFEGRKIFALYDIDNLLGKKNSPIDDGIDVWNKLVKDYKFEIIPKKVV